MKKLSFLILAALVLLALPKSSFAAGGIYASGGGTRTVGETFTVTVVASGATFDSIHGKISIGGPVSVVSFSSGSATWMSEPSNGGTFDGTILGKKVSSFTIATIKLKGTSAGNGSVTISNAQLLSGGNVVGSGSGNASYTIQKALVLPGTVSVSSTSHPDQSQAYEATTIALSWTKASNVTGFSYLLDQSSGTTPASKVTDSNTSANYTNQAIGTYYFHIKAQSADGWGPVTHFKMTIKEPDPKINEDLGKPSDIKVSTSDETLNDIAKGTFSGIKITGNTAPNYTANIKLDPAVTLPEGKTLFVKADENGSFELLLDFPINVGHYTMTVQGQDNKVLTPVSDPVYFEINQSQGGSVMMLTANDNEKPVVANKPIQTKKWYQKIDYRVVSASLAVLLLISIAGIIFIVLRNKRDRNLIHHLKTMK